MKSFKKVMISLVVGNIVITPFINSNVDAMEQPSFKVGGRKDYQEIQGTHLMVNVTGVDKKGNEILVSDFIEFPLTPGEVLTKKDILNYVQIAIDAKAADEYRVINLAPNSKIEVSYSNNKSDIFPITDKGFVIPHLTKHLENPSFKLITNVVLEEKSSTDNNQVFSNSTEVSIEHFVKFLKRDNESNILLPINTGRITNLKEKHHVGDKITENDLLKAAEIEFKKTKEYKEGYRIVKRLNANVIENGVSSRILYDYQDNKPFNYTISGKRQPAKLHTDGLSDTYYISKNGDDYPLN
ncbi:staphylokinase domain-containing protein [Mammaliicoccus lentus]|uniref:staphylokinase domain-containing protein n=1 Tax=Mammaliicoccus lentus TaxID=42858 RepID=UPI001B324B77|nr:staphylokinase domain-containing protein [Mammaliicoccus lentus]